MTILADLKTRGKVIKEAIKKPDKKLRLIYKKILREADKRRRGVVR